MAYREIAMWEILEVLRRVHRGEGQRAIQRVTGHGRTTIRRWVACATELGWAPALQVPDEALARRAAERMKPLAVSRAPGESEGQLAAHRAQIRARLAPDARGRGLRLSKIHQLLARQGERVPYSSLHRFAVQHCGFRNERRVTVRVAEVAAGELAEVDFGRLGWVHDPETGKRVWVRGDSKLVRIYVAGVLVKTNERVEAGKRSTDYHDYPKERAPYAMRDPEAIFEEARRRGDGIGRFAEKLLAGPFRWSKLRQAQKLLRLAERYGPERLDAACHRALGPRGREA